jgi:S1-C subfamily serine protease
LRTGSEGSLAMPRAGAWVLRLAAGLLAGVTSPALAIVGPATEDASLAQHVVMVLQHQGATAGFCTGIVLAPTVVMTAAHCVPAGAELRIHFPNPGREPALLPVREVARHPGYRADAIRTRERSVDLAVLRLPDSLPDRFSPARLGPTGDARVGSAFTVAGFGVTHEGEAASSGHLRAATLVARPPLSKVLLWAGDPAGREAGACTGDSGGPVLDADGTVVALTLWASGRNGRQCGELTQALWLAPHRRWLDDTIAHWAAQPTP